jgi:hypothetical protein
MFEANLPIGRYLGAAEIKNDLPAEASAQAGVPIKRNLEALGYGERCVIKQKAVFV